MAALALQHGVDVVSEGPLSRNVPMRPSSAGATVARLAAISTRPNNLASKSSPKPSSTSSSPLSRLRLTRVPPAPPDACVFASRHPAPYFRRTKSELELIFPSAMGCAGGIRLDTPRTTSTSQGKVIPPGYLSGYLSGKNASATSP